MKQNLVILLTACVNPNGMAFTVLQDKNVRLRQYIDSINYYLQTTCLPIVVCENTNTDIARYFKNEMSSHRLEFLSFEGNNYDKNKGKGYGEALIIEYAINNSEFIKKSDSIIKITGRLKIENIAKLLNKAKKKNCIYADIVRTNIGNFGCRSVCFIAPIVFLKKYFLSSMDVLNDSENRYFEHLLFLKCKQWRQNGYYWKEFSLPLFIKGQSGSTGRDYYLKHRWLMYLRKQIKLLIHYFFLKYILLN